MIIPQYVVHYAGISHGVVNWTVIPIYLNNDLFEKNIIHRLVYNPCKLDNKEQVLTPSVEIDSHQMEPR